MAEAVVFRNISKRFNLQSSRARSLQELVIGALHHRNRQDSRGSQDFWALRDVSFSVEQGETLGLIGPNGSGKSTVLKLISGILQPTEGSVTVNGRVSALLELGTGFHPDLTGRENVFLYGSILGLSNKTISSKLSEIIEFSELEQFIDVPVKHYSTGMLMRLGFSTAVYVDPDILLVDEVLAVGDAQFQQRCINRILDLKADDGKTILFVSHSENLIRGLCDRVVWLQDGRLVGAGRADKMVSAYKEAASGEDDQIRWQQRRIGSFDAEIIELSLSEEGGDGRSAEVVTSGNQMLLRMRVRFHEPATNPIFGFILHRDEGLVLSRVYDTNSFLIDGASGDFRAGQEVEVLFRMKLNLLAGRYLLTCALAYEDTVRFYDWQENTLIFGVLDDGRGHGIANLQAKLVALSRYD
jgi:lipopolysaccharide transport system ATP-binding protein